MTELPQREDFGDYAQWPGRAVLDPTGRRLGEVREIYLDDATDRPEWVLVELGEDARRYVPLADATVDDDAIRVAHAADSVQAAPSLGQQKELSQDEERRLYSHYGLRTSEEASDSLLPDPDQPPATAEEPAPALAATPPATPEEPTPALAATPPTTPEEPTPALAATPPTDGEADRPRPEAAAPEPEPAAMVENPPPVLPATGETSEPEDRGPMVPPRPEPIAPPRLEPAPSGPLAAVRANPVPIAAGLAASLAALVFIVRRRR